MFLFWYDPLTLMAMFIAYIVGYIALFIIAGTIAPKVASRLSNRFTLYTSMFIAMAIVLIGGFASIYLISILVVEVAGLSPYLLGGLVLFIVLMNIITYIISPYMINLFYGAKPDSRLQEIVDSVARRAGLKPPKAVVVEGPPNAFAYGNFLTGRYVAVSSSMLGLVNRSELEAVIGHELGHHKHRDTVILLLMGLIPSVLYYLGIILIRTGLIGGMTRSERREGGGGLVLMLIGIASIILSFIMQVLILTFSRLREYYADAHGALVAGAKNMQRALAKLHIYYHSYPEAREYIHNSKLKTLFIYALVNTVANPYYDYIPYHGNRSRRYHETNIDRVIEILKREKTNPALEVFSSHPPIPKRIRFLDKVVVEDIRA